MKLILVTWLFLVFQILAHGQCENLSENYWNESWVSCEATENPALPGYLNNWILYDFGQVYVIDSFHLYNYNLSDLTLGIKNFVLFSSFDSVTWNYQEAMIADKATGLENYQGQHLPLSASFQARYILLSIVDNYGGACYGISEVAFGIDYETCADFNPAMNVKYELCSDQFTLSIDPFVEQTYYWSNGDSVSTIQTTAAGDYSVIVSTDECTDVISTSLIKPESRSNGWNSNETIPNGQYLILDPITSSGRVKKDDDVRFFFEPNIVFTPQFQVEDNAAFEASQINCQNDPSSYYFEELVQATMSAYPFDDYIGAGHSYGIHQTGSGSTINGFGLLSNNASYRFLNQSSFGASSDMVEQLRHTGYEEWFDWQTSLPHTSYFNHLEYHERFSPRILYWIDWHRTWWTNILSGEEYLRDRMAYALSQIFVISSKSLLLNFADGLTDYYDMLAEHSFGNYRDLLYDVTLHPTMGHYLSHMSNPKTDASKNQFPDENYAREVLQLFSIGLYELNIDGSRKKDSQGKDIPTYDNDDIIEFAKVFTGLTGDGQVFGTPVRNIVNENADSYMTRPMVMHEDQHEPGPKHLLNNYTVPAGQTGLKDINDAIDNIFAHPNVGPFIGKRLIQRFVKSDPSPAYIQRVAETFNNNGQGVRGDLKAVLKAILLDEEARDCSWIDDPKHGKLKEPILRFTQLFKAFEISSSNDAFYTEGARIEFNTGQAPLRSPSVFNFYTSDYRPPGLLSDVMTDAPEFQILNSSTSIGYINLLDSIAVHDSPLVLEEGTVSLNFDAELALAHDNAALIEHLNTKLTNGTLRPATIHTIKESLDQMPSLMSLEKVKLAIYLIAASPEFAVLK